MAYASYREVESDVLRWADARKITTNGKAVGQAKKTVEEAAELHAACVALEQLQPGSAAYAEELRKAQDAIGDVLVTLVTTASRLTTETGTVVDVVQCFKMAYDEIKGRKGHLGPDGIFYKEV